MSKKLAIKGHRSRGNEVIALLKMLGGEAINAKGYDESAIYVIPINGIIDVRFAYQKHIDDYAIFTLEEFLEKYPYKVGDKVTALFQSDKTATGGFCTITTVTIKSMRWSEDCETMVYDFEESEDVLCADDILKSVNDNYTKQNKETITPTPTPTPDITANVTDKNNCDIQCPDGYEFYDENGNLIGTKVMMRLKKPVYPKTLKECQTILNYSIGSMSGYKASILASLQDLLICRDAYWKIAGEQMGLGKPWEPDWNDEIQKYCIRTDRNKIVNCSSSFNNRILAFPTVEMRDTFYENFKDLIEHCKELL